MFEYCQPNRLPDGRETAWGTVDPEQLFGPQGWCNAPEPQHLCACIVDGWGGPYCDEPIEPFCFNQCNGRGECLKGFCKCDPGWHGIDCAHRSATPGVARQGRQASVQPWIAELVHTPAAQDPLPGATRRRPLIFVYEMAADYGTLLAQYRFGTEDCVPRFFKPGNKSVLSTWTYSLEFGLLEMMLQSEHRTLDPEEADFFYVPVFPSCFIWPVRSTADSLRDFYYGWAQSRVQGAANLLLEAYHWLRAHYPYWDRRGGRDHIWLVTHDEASCYVPAAIKSASIILSHWGRKDPNHTSGTGFPGNVYHLNVSHPHWEPEGSMAKLDLSQPCHDPVKDLVLPLMKTPDHYHQSPLVGAPTRNRTWLAFHRGRHKTDAPEYSRGVRQRLWSASQEHGWLDKYGILLGENPSSPGAEEVKLAGDYSQLLASSIFCLVLPGDGWSARMDDATLHGCIPVIVMDEVDVSFESVIDLQQFTVRVAQADVERLPEILLEISQERRQEMQRALGRVWHKLTYSSYRPYAKRFRQIQADHKQEAAAAGGGADGGGLGGETALALSLPEAVVGLDPEADDAFATLMGWLYSRIDATR